jgi:hypothetical protein
MLALTWTALAILAAFSLGVLALQVSQNARIDTLRDRMETRFDGVNERFERLEATLRTVIKDSLAEHEARRHG